MLRRRRDQTTTTIAPAFDDFHEWVLSLPWVVERAYSVGTPGVRCFGVECDPLGRRQLWLLTGMHPSLGSLGSLGRSIGLAVIVPADVADELNSLGWGRVISPMPGGHVLVTVQADSLAGRQELEALVLTAYGCAMS
jgi:hypothetical protein